MKSAFGVVSIIVFLYAGILPTPKAFGQGHSLKVQLRSIEDSLITLPNDFIIPKSLQLTIDGSIRLQNGKDFVVDSALKSIILSLALRQTFFSIPSGQKETAPARGLEIKYSILPLNLHRTYS